MELIIKRVLNIINNSSLYVEILSGTIRELGIKAGLGPEETLQIIEDNYREWEK